MKKSWKSKTLLIGTIIGAAVGAASAYLLIQRAENDESKPKLTPGEGLQVGLGLLGLMRLIAGFGED